MKQIEIEFFFPFVEQIPLDLDFSQCSPHQYYLRAKGIAGSEGPFPTGTIYVSDTNASWSTTLDASNLTIQSDKKVNWFGRKLYDIMGLKWQQKTS